MVFGTFLVGRLPPSHTNMGRAAPRAGSGEKELVCFCLISHEAYSVGILSHFKDALGG